MRAYKFVYEGICPEPVIIVAADYTEALAIFVKNVAQENKIKSVEYFGPGYK